MFYFFQIESEATPPLLLPGFVFRNCQNETLGTAARNLKAFETSVFQREEPDTVRVEKYDPTKSEAYFFMCFKKNA
jgi:hypothetical protein